MPASLEPRQRGRTAREAQPHRRQTGWLQRGPESPFWPATCFTHTMAQPFQVTGLISQAERSSCFPSSHLCARSCSQFLVSLHGDPQGYFPSRAPRMQGIGAPILAKISKEELLGRLSPAQRREGEIGHPDLGKHRNQASSGFWGTELIHLFT